MKLYKSPSEYRYCISTLSILADGNFSVGRKVFSTTPPFITFLILVRTNAAPFPGFTCWNSMIWYTLPSISSVMPFLKSPADIINDAPPWKYSLYLFYFILCIMVFQVLFSYLQLIYAIYVLPGRFLLQSPLKNDHLHPLPYVLLLNIMAVAGNWQVANCLIKKTKCQLFLTYIMPLITNGKPGN